MSRTIMEARLGVIGARLLVPAIILFASTPAFAQYPIPDQLSVGVGVVGDQRPRQSAPTVTFSLAYVDSGSDYWPYRLSWVFLEGELGSRSDLEPCQARDAGSADLPDCEDAALMTGLRFYFYHRSSGRRVLPFVNLMAGSYWKGGAADDAAFVSEHVTLLAGGGIDLRGPRGSAHGLRVSVDYRRVFAGDASRNQVRFVTSYTLGPPKP